MTIIYRATRILDKWCKVNKKLLKNIILSTYMQYMTEKLYFLRNKFLLDWSIVVLEQDKTSQVQFSVLTVTGTFNKLKNTRSSV